MKQKELNAILEAHSKWLRDEDGGIRADLCGADLCGANLRGADLCGANLRGANLCEANLCEAKLCGANLRGANLCEANLCEAKLCGAKLCEADLYGMDLCGADLCGANLRGADLCGVSLREANLYRVDLRRANLCEADLCGADLCGADLTNARGVPPIVCPETGSFIGYKKAYYMNGILCTPLIVTLRVEEDALRSSATTRKCRCSKATILCAESLSGVPMAEQIDITSGHDSAFVYRVGDTIEIPNFEPDRWIECAPGFHFFITKQEAIEY